MSYHDDENEIAEGFRAMREASQERRAKNRDSSRQILVDRGIPHEVKNAGAHLVVTGSTGVIDFWPGTGKFIGRNGGPRGRGVFKLLRHCEDDA